MVSNIQLYMVYMIYTDCNIQLYTDTWSVSSHQYSWLLAHAHLLALRLHLAQRRPGAQHGPAAPAANTGTKHWRSTHGVATLARWAMRTAMAKLEPTQLDFFGLA